MVKYSINLCESEEKSLFIYYGDHIIMVHLTGLILKVPHRKQLGDRTEVSCTPCRRQAARLKAGTCGQDVDRGDNRALFASLRLHNALGSHSA